VTSPGDWDGTLDDLRERRHLAAEMGGDERVARHRSAGKLTARERVDVLLDTGTFGEIGRLAGALPADGVVTGTGEVDGRSVAVLAEDFTVAGGSIGAVNTAKRHRIVTLAVQERMPVVVLLEGAGHRPPMPDDPPTIRAPNDLQALADGRGRVPIATAVLGPSAGHGALAAPLADFTVMTAAAAIFTAGPPLVRAALGEVVTPAELGGPDVALASGVVHNVAADDDDALDQVRRWLSYLPSSAWAAPPIVDTADGPRPIPELTTIVPRDSRIAYDMAQVVRSIVDAGSWFEVQPRFGASILTGHARFGGRSVAIVANQPAHLGGAIDVAAAEKAASFIDVADAFHLPLLFLTDNPGVMAGTAAERAGILRAAGRMFVAQHRATVPKLQVTLRKAYGFGSTAMGMNPFGGQTVNVAFPGVTFGAMPSRGADDATHADDAARAAMRQAELASGLRSASGLSVDDLIEPSELRNVVLAGIRRAAARLDGPFVPRR
jgi:acetyl-CoA carboxylase carboxyltransferase component